MSRHVFWVAAFAAFLLSGCATLPDSHTLMATPIPVTQIAGAPAIQDGRAQFRAVFCSIMRANGLAAGEDPTCDRWLWRLPDEPLHADVRPAAAPAPESLAIFLVTGAFSECVGEEARPLSAGAARLRAAGSRVETIVVSGRSGSDHNAQQIADVLGQAQLRGDQTIILMGFSKGALDILHFLVNFPALASQVNAVVSIASPVFGSRLADKTETAYSTLFAKFPYYTCPPGDGQIMRSLRTDTTTQWLSANALPAHVRYYSLASFTTREHVARGLVPTWKFLNRTDPRNDGQVIAADTVIPGATLLGYANADHWGVATTIESVHTYLGGRPDPTLFPQVSLFDSIVQFVADDLGRARAGTGNLQFDISTGTCRDGHSAAFVPGTAGGASSN